MNNNKTNQDYDDLQLELATMKVMLYSLHNAIEDIITSITTNGKISTIEEWNKECEETAKIILDKESEE